MSKQLLQRFSFIERIVHWIVGISFVVLLLTGFALSYPALFWLTIPFGGGPATRVLHPWTGVVFGVGVVAMVALWVREMFLTGSDWQWLGAVRYYATHQRSRVPPAGKYNAGQKLFFWAQAMLAVVLLVTGVRLWFPETVGVADWLAAARLIHYLAALPAGMLLVLHVYLGTMAYPGTARAMIDGRVTRRWAALHHPRWQTDTSTTSTRHEPS